MQPHGPPEAQPGLTSALSSVCRAPGHEYLETHPPIHLPPGAVLQREAFFQIKELSGGVLWSQDEEPATD